MTHTDISYIYSNSSDEKILNMNKDNIMKFLPHAVCSSLAVLDSSSQVLSQSVASPGEGLILLLGHNEHVLSIL